jgi:hypothetical protein
MRSESACSDNPALFLANRSLSANMFRLLVLEVDKQHFILYM